MSGLSDQRARFGISDLVLYAVGVAGLAMCLTLVFLSMRAVMDVGGFCADGGPYVIAVHCPQGVPLLFIGGIVGLFGFGGLMLWKGSAIGSPYGGLVALAWPALFLSLGWNFVEYALGQAAGEGIIWAWLIPGVLFVLMGGVPLLALLPIGTTGRAGKTRERMAGSVVRRPRPSPVLDAERAEMATQLTRLFGQMSADGSEVDQEDLVSKLERLAALHRAGLLSAEEFEQAKRALIGGFGT